MWPFQPKSSGRKGKGNVGKDAKGSGGDFGSVYSLYPAPHCPSLILGPSELHSVFLTYILWPTQASSSKILLWSMTSLNSKCGNGSPVLTALWLLHEVQAPQNDLLSIWPLTPNP